MSLGGENLTGTETPHTGSGRGPKKFLASRVKAIFQKEITGFLRDRRTLFAMIGIPILLYPILMTLHLQLVIPFLKESRLVVGLYGESVEPVEKSLGELEGVYLTRDVNPEDALNNPRKDVVLYFHQGFNQAIEDNRSGRYELLVDHTDRGDLAAQLVQNVLNNYAANELIARQEEASEELGRDEEYFMPVTRIVREQTDLASPELDEEGRAVKEKRREYITWMSLVFKILPISIVIFALTGAFYPAIDITAGEKERHTLETLLVSPATRLEIVLGKFTATLALSILTSILNIVSIAVTFGASWEQLNPIPGTEIPHPPLATVLGAIGLVFVAMIPICLIFSAVMLAVASFSRSFKEAQNYLTPAYLTFFLPCLITLVPGTGLTLGGCFIPVANVCLMFKELGFHLLDGAPVPPLFIVLTMLANLGFAALGLMYCVKLFQREEIITAAEDQPATALINGARRKLTGALPTIGEALIVYLFGLVLLILVGARLQLSGGMPNLPGIVVSQIAFFGIPLFLALAWARRDVRRSLSLKAPKIKDILLTVVMTAALIPLAWDLLVFFHKINFFGSAGEAAQQMGALFQKSDNVSWLAFIAVFALTPAICEELLMRGMLTAAYRRVYSFNATVIVIGVLFGLLHLYLARVPSTALVGMVLTYIVLRTGSIFPAMLMHLLFNGSLLFIANHEFFLTVPWIADQEWAPLGIVLPAVALLIACWRYIGSNDGDAHLKDHSPAIH